MLVLTRKVEESLTIGRDITVRVLAVDGSRVSLGIEAPPSTAVWRTEMLERKKVNRETQPTQRRRTV